MELEQPNEFAAPMSVMSQAVELIYTLSTVSLEDLGVSGEHPIHFSSATVCTSEENVPLP